MAQKKRKRRMNKRKFFFRILTFAIILYAGYQMAQNLMNPYEKYALDYGEVNVEATYTSFVMRNETLVLTQNSGEIHYFTKDGERVKRGHKVAEIVVNDQSVAATTVVNAEPLTEEKVSVSKEELELEIQTIRDEILDHIQTQNIFKINALKEELQLKLEKRDRLSKTHELVGLKSKPYTEAFVGSAQAQSGQVLDARSPESGIITFTSDGYEDVLDIEKLYDVDYYQLASQPIKVVDLKTDSVSAGAPLYKLVDNSVWYVVALIEQQDIRTYQEMITDSISVEFNGEIVRGKVFDVFETGNQSGALVIQFKNQATGFYNERKKDLKITRENYRGLKVPKDAIIVKGGTEGVYVLGVENKVEFVPVKEIGKNEEDVIVHESRFYEKVNGEVVEVNTVDQFNMIIRNPENINEGDIIY